MTKGDLVCLSRCGELSEGNNMVGVILDNMHDTHAMHNDVFKVWWANGTVQGYVWDYDLKVLNEKR